MPNDPGSAARAYHEATKHSLASVRHDPHRLDWDTMPRPFKVYPDLPPLALPRDFATGPGAALDLAALARLLYFTAGVLRHRTYPGGEIFFRAAACTGALYHVDLYLVTATLPELDAGVWHFGPHDFALRRLREGDHRGVLAAGTADNAAIRAAPVTLVCTSTFWRNAWKYRARAYRHVYWDGGTIAANLLAVAGAGSLPARVVTGFVDDVIDRLVDVDGEREASFALVAVGTGAPALPPPPDVAPLGLAVLPCSAREVAYPIIPRTHAASRLDTPAAVAAWRATPPAAVPRPPEGPRVPLPPSLVVPEPIETVILRRGSARAFAHEPIPLAALATVLRAAAAPVPADAHAPATVYGIAHAVEGLEPGSFVFDAATAALVPLRRGAFRREAGLLGLGQALPADASACLYWLAELDPLLARLGSRGYRVAQLEAAIGGGRAYLAAYALGLGATGLTFFDDDVTAFFSPCAAGASVLFHLAIGRPRRQKSR